MLGSITQVRTALFILNNFILHSQHNREENMWLFLFRIISCLILINLISYTTAEAFFCFLFLSLSLFFSHTHTQALTCTPIHSPSRRHKGCLFLCVSLSSPPHLWLSSPLLPLNTPQLQTVRHSTNGPHNSTYTCVCKCVRMHAWMHESIQYSCKRARSCAYSKRAVMNLWHDYVLQKLCTLITLTGT